MKTLLHSDINKLIHEMLTGGPIKGTGPKGVDAKGTLLNSLPQYASNKETAQKVWDYMTKQPQYDDFLNSMSSFTEIEVGKKIDIHAMPIDAEEICLSALKTMGIIS